jgi:hypothetical protein
MAYAGQAHQLAIANADEYARAKEERARKEAAVESSDERSTTDFDAVEPESNAASGDGGENETDN